MKRTVPLAITALGGFVLIFAFFIPATENWGEVAAIWFDILAAIAFILGGGNLLKIHLKKISDQAKGWGYSAVTLIAFLAMLCFGLFKVGSSPSAKQEHYGEVFARLPLENLPESQVFKVEGTLPEKASGKKQPPSVRRQLSEEDGQLVFRGWMLPDQKTDLLEFEDTLEWQAAVEKLAEKAKPPSDVGKVKYYADHSAVAFGEVMTDVQKSALLKLARADNTAWQEAVETLHERSNQTHSIPLEELPAGVTSEHLKDPVSYNASEKQLSIKGPMSTKRRDELAQKPFALSRPLRGEDRAAFLAELEKRGEKLNVEQRKIFTRILDGGWSVEQLIKTLNAAGKVPEEDKEATTLLAEKKRRVKVLKLKERKGFPTELSDAHQQALREFAASRDETTEELIKRLNAIDRKRFAPWVAAAGAGGFVPRGEEIESTLFVERQEKALKTFASRIPTVGQRNAKLAVALLRAGPLSQEQREFLTADYRREKEWRQTVGKLFVAAHTVKYSWSGEYRETGSPFWWMYEYAFKPLTATMFAMLAFYVASAAFRAFRAKNLEAILLLGTAFIILLGRTFAGVMLTDWIPENSAVSGLRIEQMTVYIMTVFNTAGNRAIMIGIALGIASTSLKVLLGVDRSYLGTQED